LNAVRARKTKRAVCWTQSVTCGAFRENPVDGLRHENSALGVPSQEDQCLWFAVSSGSVPVLSQQAVSAGCLSRLSEFPVPAGLLISSAVLAFATVSSPKNRASRPNGSCLLIILDEINSPPAGTGGRRQNISGPSTGFGVPIHSDCRGESSAGRFGNPREAAISGGLLISSKPLLLPSERVRLSTHWTVCCGRRANFRAGSDDRPAFSVLQKT
jgi:hypothetical protein